MDFGKNEKMKITSNDRFCFLCKTVRTCALLEEYRNAPFRASMSLYACQFIDPEDVLKIPQEAWEKGILI